MSMYLFAASDRERTAASALWNSTSSIAASMEGKISRAAPASGSSEGSVADGEGTTESKYFPSMLSDRFRRFPRLFARSELIRSTSAFREKSPSFPNGTSRRRK